MKKCVSVLWTLERQVMVEGTGRQGWYRQNALARAPKDAPLLPAAAPEESLESPSVRRAVLCRAAPCDAFIVVSYLGGG